MSNRIRITGLALLLLCTLALGWVSGDRFNYSDERDYSALAQSLLHQQTFAYANGKPIESRPPGYPFVLAAVYSVIERPVAGKLLNAVFLTVAAYLLGLLVRRQQPGADALVPYLILLYPLLLYAASTLYPQILACPLLMLVILLVTRSPAKPGHFIAAGLAYGFLILAVPYFLALLPLVAVHTCIWGAAPRRRAVVLAAILMVCSALVVLPWTLRNYAVFHTWVPVSANNGYNLFVGNSPATSANSGLNVPVLKLCNHLHPRMTESDFDDAFKQCAIDWIKANPADAARLYVGKVLNYFNYRNEVATSGQNLRWRDWVVFATYYPLLLLVVARAAFFRRYPLDRAEILIYLLYFLNAFASAIFFTRLRFRLPLDFLLIAIAAPFLHRLFNDSISKLARRSMDGAVATRRGLSLD